MRLDLRSDTSNTIGTISFKMSAANQQARQQTPRKRVIHQLDTPFTTVSWPEISSRDQDTMLELLCSLLSPIGHHRQEYIQKSKGKKARRKVKKEAERITEDILVPPEPPIMSHVDIGFNTITKSLQNQSQPRISSEFDTKLQRRYSVVFVTRGDQSQAFNCHFPQMVGAATRSLPDMDKTRLVGFSRACSERLSLALGIPRVSSVALVADAPGATALEEMVRCTVPGIVVPWLAAPPEEYLPTTINAIQTTVGNKKTRLQ
ncbi:hypothetical protein NLU13_7006 [Sarocladium strictum]|uniref:Uncharacterized protein n=1 Tax=Sarocladium strictum TaxID=5046 RepID=A0AA39GF59_SARSR|nr:hypothetical protein NLU13_7006 [Sarocladium strictum]